MSSTASTSTTTSSESVSAVSTSTGSSASTSSISSTSFTSSTSSTSSTSTSASTSTPSTKNTSAGTSSSSSTRTDTVGTSSSTQTETSSSTQSSTRSSSSSSASVSSTTWVSTSTSHAQNTASRTSSPTSSHGNSTTASSSPSSSASSSTTTGPQRELSTTSITPSSTFQLQSTSQAPISTSAVSPSPSTSGVPDSTPAVVHELFIDAGNCANVGTPKVLDEATGSNVGLTSLGGGQYSLVMRPSDVPGGGIGAFVFMADDGSRCGQDAGYCSVVHIILDETSDILIGIERAGDRGRNMYPVKIWMDDAFTWDAQPANSSVNASHCWGWSNVECPNSFMYRNDPPWTISSQSRTARVFVSFCPPDGPALSDVPPNPNPPDFVPEIHETFILLPTSTVIPVSTFTFGTTSTPNKGVAASAPAPTGSIPSCDVLTTCVLLNTYISIGEPSTVVSKITLPPQSPTVYYSTFIILGTTTTIPVTTYFGRPATVSPTPTPTPAPTVTSWIMASTDTQRSTIVSGWTFLTLSTPTSTPPGTVSTITSLPTSTRRRTRTTTALSTSTARTRANVVGTIDDVTTSQEPATPTVSDSATTTPLPVSDDGLVTTSWTTWVTVGNTTSTIVVGEVGVQTTVPATYALEPSTTIPIGELSSISVRSTSTALPSPSNTVSAKAESNSRDNSSVIAGATVGTLVGLTLAFLLFWLFCYKRRRKRSGDYMAQRASPVWSGAGGGGGSGLLDLDSEPRVRESFVEPWVQPLPPPPRRKEMESLSGGVSAGYGATSMSGGAGMSTAGAAGPSREPESSSTESGPGPSSLSSHFVSSNEHAALTRPGKTVVRGQSQSSSVPRRPEQSHYQRPSLANPSVSLLPTPFEAGAPGSPRARGPDQVGQSRYLVDRRPTGEAQQPRQYLDDPEQPRHNAIPPQYNEAWNTAL